MADVSVAGSVAGQSAFTAALTVIPLIDIVSVTTDPLSRNGCFVFGGEASVVDWIDPDITAFTAEGGFKFSGVATMPDRWIDPPTTEAYTSSGGFAMAGVGAVALIDPAQLINAVTAQGGFAMGGVGVVVSFEDADLITEIVSEGGFVFWGEFFTGPVWIDPVITVPLELTSSGGLEMGGQGVVELLTPDIFIVAVDQGQEFDGDFKFQGQGFVELLTPAIDLIEASGGFYFSGLGVVEGDEYHETWVLSGYHLEPSLYTGFDFNSYATFHGKAYGAREDGIYLLEGEDDDGTPIVTGMRLGPLNFGTEHEKRLRYIRPGNTGTEIEAQVKAGEEKGIFYQDGERIPVSRDIQGKEFTIDIQGFEKLDYLEIMPLVLLKR